MWECVLHPENQIYTETKEDLFGPKPPRVPKTPLNLPRASPPRLHRIYLTSHRNEGTSDNHNDFVGSIENIHEKNVRQFGRTQSRQVYLFQQNYFKGDRGSIETNLQFGKYSSSAKLNRRDQSLIKQ